MKFKIKFLYFMLILGCVSSNLLVCDNSKLSKESSELSKRTKEIAQKWYKTNFIDTKLAELIKASKSKGQSFNFDVYYVKSIKIFKIIIKRYNDLKNEFEKHNKNLTTKVVSDTKNKQFESENKEALSVGEGLPKEFTDAISNAQMIEQTFKEKIAFDDLSRESRIVACNEIINFYNECINLIKLKKSPKL